MQTNHDCWWNSTPIFIQNDKPSLFLFLIFLFFLNFYQMTLFYIFNHLLIFTLPLCIGNKWFAAEEKHGKKLHYKQISQIYVSQTFIFWLCLHFAIKWTSLQVIRPWIKKSNKKNMTLVFSFMTQISFVIKVKNATP